MIGFGDRSPVWMVLLCFVLSRAPVCRPNALYYSVVDDGSLRELPTDIPLDVFTISIRNADIAEIRSNAFINFTRLNALSLMSNGISYIAPDAFRGCSINFLNLDDNQLTVSSLPSLNQISHSLLRINLNQNPINVSEEIWVETLKNLTNLVGLSLIAMRIPMTSFLMLPSNLNKLGDLDFSHNRIPVVEKKDLSNVPDLLELRLAANRLSSLPDIRDTKIRLINLGDNPLVCDEKIAWLKQIGTRTLWISYRTCASPSYHATVPWADLTYEDLNPASSLAENSSIRLLLDGNDTTCIDPWTELAVMTRAVPLTRHLSEARISVSGQNLSCSDSGSKNGLQLYVNVEPNSVEEDACQLGKFKQCVLRSSEPALCQFDCECPDDNIGCLEGRLFWTRPTINQRDSPLICEVLIDKI